MSKITNPISTTQVTEVSLLKSDCMDFCGNTLNDWLKFLVDKQCEIDWSRVDTSCLDAYSCPTDKNLKSIIEKLINAVCTLQQTTTSGCCGCGSSTSTIVEELVTLAARWADVDFGNPARCYLQDGWVKLSGTITGGSTQTDLFTVHSSMIPTYQKRLPFAHTFNLPDVSNEHPFIQINTSGVASIVWVGLTPNDSLGGTIYLDGLQYKLT